MKRKDDLRSVFGDDVLEPNPQFVRRLGKQLASPKRQRWSIRRMYVGAGAMAALAVVAGAVWAYGGTHQRHQLGSVKVSAVYTQALASPLETDDDVTFWDVREISKTGPAAKACGWKSTDTNTQHSLFFKQGSTTAIRSTNDMGQTQMQAYSEDADVPAFDLDVLDIRKQSGYGYLVAHGKLMDEDGNLLADNAAIPRQTTGSYTIYLKMPEGFQLKDAGCGDVITLTVDARSNMVTNIRIYKEKIAGANLTREVERTIHTQAGDFNSVLPIFEQAGFSLDEAKRNGLLGTILVVNKDASYEFGYQPFNLGKASLETVGGNNGQVGAYVYTYAKQLLVKQYIYTKNAAQMAYGSMEDFANYVKAQGWKVIDESNGTNMYGLYSQPMHLLQATDGVKTYTFYQTGFTEVPYVYLEAPAGGVMTESPYMPAGQSNGIDATHNLWQIIPLKPGTEEPLAVG